MKPICPICQKEIQWEGNRYRPFCSERCKRVDLGRWASGGYRIAAPPEEEEASTDPGEDEESSDEGENGTAPA